MKNVGNELLHDLVNLRQAGKFGLGKLSANEQTDLISKLDDIALRLDDRLKNPPPQYGKVRYPQKPGNTQDQFILNKLFSAKKQIPANLFSASLLCVLSFVKWCKDEISTGNLPGELLLRFPLECHVFKILEGDFFTQGYISNIPISFCHYQNIAKSALFGSELDGQTSLLLTLFGFRQVFENRCKGMLGYLGANPLLKYPDGIFAKVLGSAKGLKEHVAIPHVSILELSKLADWTNYSIHNQIIPPSWMIWKLFDLSEWFFSPPKMNNQSTSWNIFGGFSCSVDDLKIMRSDFVSRIKEARKRHPNHSPEPFTLYWDNNIAHLELVINDKDELQNLEDKEVVLI